MGSKPLCTLCLTCSGSGDLETPTAYLPRGTNQVKTAVVTRECWFCHGDGWIPFAKRREN